MSTGKITQIIGAVVDVAFPPAAVPPIYHALSVSLPDEQTLVLEVQQQLGGGG